MKNGDPDVNKTDIYGIGALLYRLITFETPWHHDEELKNARRNKDGHGANCRIRQLVGKLH